LSLENLLYKPTFPSVLEFSSILENFKITTHGTAGGSDEKMNGDTYLLSRRKLGKVIPAPPAWYFVLELFDNEPLNVAYSRFIFIFK
jgi:hypothetical protein